MSKGMTDECLIKACVDRHGPLVKELAARYEAAVAMLEDIQENMADLSPSAVVCATMAEGPEPIRALTQVGIPESCLLMRGSLELWVAEKESELNAELVQLVTPMVNPSVAVFRGLPPATEGVKPNV